MIYYTWTNLKARAALLGAPIQFTETADRITVTFVDGGTTYGTVLWKTNTAAGIPATNAADLADFEANYRNSLTINQPVTPRNALGQVVQAKSAYAYSEENGTFVGTNVIHCPANTTTIYDLPVTTELYVNGGKAWVAGPPTLGDWIKFSVVDTDDILGLFSTYGLSVANGDVLELRQYVRNMALPPFNSHFTLHMETAAKVVSGLKLRATIYNLSSVNAFDASIDYTVFMKD